MNMIKLIDNQLLNKTLHVVHVSQWHELALIRIIQNCIVGRSDRYTGLHTTRKFGITTAVYAISIVAPVNRILEIGK
jgi:hypothetical protein